MRIVTVVLIALLVLVQYPLWWGSGGWLRVHDLQQQLANQLQKNADAKDKNDRLAGEVDDLQHGTDAVEERARYELGMIKQDEVFVQFVSPAEQMKLPANGQSNLSTRGVMSATPLAVVPEPPAHGRAQTKRMAEEAAKHKAATEKARERRARQD
ncbi:cell division protein FtsB [Robbsia sp. KACC 23696]|uniref:cell division protein FtsB n=1 Tax=Robbsia sp. KACC 23696 TaxID=3149231 RepID=UPI00325BA786